MKALLIAYHFPPMQGCCAVRTGAVAEFLARAGFRCHVLSAAIPANDPVYALDSSASPNPSILVHPLADKLSASFVSRLRRFDAARHSHSTASSRRRSSPRTASRSSAFLRALAFPDSRLGWLFAARRRIAALLREESFDLLYSFGFPWSCHIAGYLTQRRTGLPWIADYADPWTQNPDTRSYPAWRKQLDFRVESHILRRASAVLTATPESAALVGHLFGPLLGQRTFVARVAQFPADLYPSSAAPSPFQFQIGFTGLLDATRAPHAFFASAQSFLRQSDARLDIAGLLAPGFEDDLLALTLDRHLRLHGRLCRSRTVALQQSSHLLLGFGWPGGLQVPCKLYEYFAARRPILWIAGDTFDPGAALIRRHRRGLVVENRAEAIAAALAKLHGLWRAGTLDSSFDLSPLPEFTLPRTFDGLQQALAPLFPAQFGASPVSVPGREVLAAASPS